MNWYHAEDAPELVEFGPVRGLAVTGQGEPGGPVYVRSVEALYAVAGPLLGIAAQAGHGFSMPVLEGRWWVEDDRPPLEVPREDWRWHLFLRLPDTVEPVWVEQARDAAQPKNPAVSRVQLATFTPGQCVQMLHHGPFEEEPKSLARMDDLMAQEGLSRCGLHHEIYLSEERTILRQPVVRT